MKITVVGAGYVGFSIALLLAEQHEVCIFDINQSKIEKINTKCSPIKDTNIYQFLKEKTLNLRGILEPQKAYEGAEYVIVATPTDFDAKNNQFDTSAVEQAVLQCNEINPDAIIVIKSTVPIGFTSKIKQRHNIKNILFCPEFLREGKSLEDNQFPSRIVVGTDEKDERSLHLAETFANVLNQVSVKKNNKIMIMNYSEAEAVKLFSNTYLAMRVSFFNELDTCAEIIGLNTRNIIDGVCADERIADGYNNPSFGYGGYCLPKDSKQLLTTYDGIPQNLMRAVVDANKTRKMFIAEQILNNAVKTQSYKDNIDTEMFLSENVTIGIYRLTMKAASDNYRQSSILDIIEVLRSKVKRVIIYEPLLANEQYFNDCSVVTDLEKFKIQSTLIVANRFDICLEDVRDKVYTRDIYMTN